MAPMKLCYIIQCEGSRLHSPLVKCRGLGAKVIPCCVAAGGSPAVSAGVDNCETSFIYSQQ